MSGADQSVIDLYSRDAKRFADKYESYDRSVMFPFLDSLVRPSIKRVLDVGAGSGVDAYKLAQKNYEVVAVEPSDLMIEGQKRYPHESISWIRDQLPELSKLGGSGLFDIILVNRVMMHVPPDSQRLAVRRLCALLSPTGFIYMISRHGPAGDQRSMYPVDLEIIETETVAAGLRYKFFGFVPDWDARPEISWSVVAILRG